MKHVSDYSSAVAFYLLKVVLPKSIQEDICGDLQEEFLHLQQNPANQMKAIKWLWLQTLSCSWRFIMTQQRFYSVLLIAMCLLLVFTLVVAINFLSVAEPTAFKQDFWINGHVHQLFTDPALWQSVNKGLLSKFTVDLLFHPTAMLYALFSFTLVYWLDKKCRFSSLIYALLSLVALALPYVGGFMYFQLNDVALKQSGPIIAFMWLSVVYLLPLFTYGLVVKRHYFTAVSQH